MIYTTYYHENKRSKPKLQWNFTPGVYTELALKVPDRVMTLNRQVSIQNIHRIQT